MWLKLIIFSALLVCAVTVAVPGGLQPQLDGRIVDGEAISIRVLPWQVSIQFAGSHRCGGSIYSPKVVVTAAHCMGDFRLRLLRVRAGSSFWTSGGVLVGIDSFKKHHNFNSTTFNNDIAVVRLNISLSWSPTIKPIGLTHLVPENGALATVSGWGQTHYHSTSIPTQLKYAEIQITDHKECSGLNKEFLGKPTTSIICAYAVGKDACHGDSGGPLVSGGVLVGVVSASRQCGTYPGVYTNVAAFRNWIVRYANLNS